MKKTFIVFSALMCAALGTMAQNNIILTNNATPVTGSSNTLVGAGVGAALTTGNENTFVGSQAGIGSTTNNGNTYLGFNATGNAALVNAGAIGHNSLVTADNNLILGSEQTRVGIGVTEGPARLTVLRGPLTAFPDLGFPLIDNYNQNCNSSALGFVHSFATVSISQIDSPFNGGLFAATFGSAPNTINGGVFGLGLCDGAKSNVGAQGSAAGIDAAKNWGVVGDAIVDEGFLNIAVVGIMGDCATPCDATRVNYAVYGECPAACLGGGTGYAGYFNGDVLCTTGNYLTSDAQFKTGVRPLGSMLDKVRALQFMQYKYKKDEFPQMEFDERTHMGVLAQELEKVFPDLVKDNLFPKTERIGKTHEAFNYKSVNYVELIPVALQAIQELDKKIEALKSGGKAGNLNNAGETSAATTLPGRGAVLNQNAPNPASSETSISYFIPDDASAALIMVVDLKGEVKLKFDNPARGNGKVQISAGDLEPGTYFYSLFCDNEFVATRKMILLGK